MVSEPKTRPTDASVDGFIAAVPNAARRADAQALKAMLDEVTGEPAVTWGPSIVGYGSYRSKSGDWPRIGFSPRKDKLVLYVMPGFEGQDDLLARLGRHATGASCLYVRTLAEVDMAVLREIAARSLAEMRARHPT